MRLFLPALSAALVLSSASFGFAACSGSTDNTPPGGDDAGPEADTGSTSDVSVSDGGSPVTAAQAASDAANAYCHALARCVPAYLEIGFGDVTSCAARLALELAPFFSANGTSTTPEQVEACAQAIPSEACADFLSHQIADVCRPKPGALADGTACSQDAQCMSTRCKIAPSDVCGTCAERAGLGAACAVDEDCQYGLDCNSSTKACYKPGALGDACDTTTPCRVDLACKNAHCTNAGALGDSCTSPVECDQIHGVICNPVSHKCEPLGFAGPSAGCGLVDGGLVTCSGPGAFCADAGAPSYFGTCTPHAADNAPCDPDAGPLCDGLSVCVHGTCKVPNPANCP
jgi:hypothetical protein